LSRFCFSPLFHQVTDRTSTDELKNGAKMVRWVSKKNSGHSNRADACCGI